MENRQVPLDDLKRQYEELSEEINRVTLETWATGKFILTQGQRVEQFEQEFATYNGTPYSVGTSSGTSALHLALKAIGIGPGDEVIVPANTYIATVFAISYTGAKPVLADVDPLTFTLDPTDVRARITPKTAAVLPVHLFGHPANMVSLLEIANQYHLAVVEDCAQAHGAEMNGQKAGTFGRAGCFSFYPTKNLGAHGDAGAVITSDEEVTHLLRRLRYMGQDVKYRHEVIGFQDRMDEVQAAILSVKLRHLDRWNDERRHQAQLYNELLTTSPVTVPIEVGGCKHVYYVYTIRAPHRDELEAYLSRQGVGVGRFYPRAIPEQPAYQSDYAPEDYQVTASLSKDSLSIPVFPGYSDEDIRYVAYHINEFYRLNS